MELGNILDQYDAFNELALYLFYFLLLCLCKPVSSWWDTFLWEGIVNKIFFVLSISYLVAAVGLQSLWSLSLAFTDLYALMVRRSFRNIGVVCLIAIGDGVRNLFNRQKNFSAVTSFLVKYFSLLKLSVQKNISYSFDYSIGSICWLDNFNQSWMLA